MGSRAEKIHLPSFGPLFLDLLTGPDNRPLISLFLFTSKKLTISSLDHQLHRRILLAQPLHCCIVLARPLHRHILPARLLQRRRCSAAWLR
jgi:hypothetical protein